MSEALAEFEHHDHEIGCTGIHHRKLIMWAFLGSDCMFFGSLISTYVIYRGLNKIPPFPKDVFDVRITSISTFVLLASSLLMVLCLAALTRNDIKQFRIWCLGTAIFGLIFLGFQSLEFTHFVHDGLTLSKSVFGSSFFVLTGTHGCHVAIGVLWLLSMFAFSFTGKLTADRALDVEIAGLYWHFVDIVWIVIFTVVYLVERVIQQAMSEATHDQPHKAHATVRDYWIIAAILAVATGIELVIPYPWVPMPAALKLFLLGFFSIAKFALVVMFFMHLYFDNPMLAGIFVFSLLMAVGTLLGLKSLFYVPSIAGTETVVKQEPLKPGDPANGPKIFASAGCIACHTITAIPEARQKVGPELDGIATRAGTRKPGMDGKAYIEESVNDPATFLVKGYLNLMPPDIRTHMTDQEFADLISYLETLK